MGDWLSGSVGEGLGGEEGLRGCVGDGLGGWVGVEVGRWVKAGWEGGGGWVRCW